MQSPGDSEDIRKDEETLQEEEPAKEEAPSQKELVWIPQEGNPLVFNQIALALGVPAEWGFTDCFGLDEEALSMIPAPCIGVILVFSTKALLNENNKSETNTSEGGKEARTTGGGEGPSSFGGVSGSCTELPPDLYFMEQVVGGACGTIAIFHLLLNLRDSILPLQEGTILRSFYDRTSMLSPPDRGAALRDSHEIFEIHQHAAQAGQTKKPRARSRPKRTGFHFVCFCRGSDGMLYELDGRKDGPVCLGSTSSETFLFDAASSIQQNYINKSSDSLRFSVLTFGPKFDW